VEVLQALVLGIVQGIAEFLPISSSGHLVLVPAILGWEEFAGNVAFDVLLHAASLTAVVLYFRRDLAELVLAVFSTGPQRAVQRRLAWLIVAGTFVTGVIGLAFDDFFESLFHSTLWTGVFLLVTATFLTLAEKLLHVRTEGLQKMRLRDALLIGLAQAAAIAPGISRAGATISAGLATGLSREQAARFSFLLSTPIILLATGKTAFDAMSEGSSLPTLLACVVGFTASAIASYFAIAWLLGYLKNRSLYPFAVYTAVIGTAVILWQIAL
jgi:undecaprenyl-diphosphatase